MDDAGSMTKDEAKSCICTIETLRRLAYNIHGVMDAVDADNCEKIIKALEQEPCEGCEVGNPCLYCRHEFEPQERSDKK